MPAYGADRNRRKSHLFQVGRAEEGLVKRLMEQAKVAVQEADDGWETDIETDDDCFV
jgi:hypothetical protein